MSMNQRTATVQAVLSTLKQRGVSYELGGSKPVSEVLTDSDKTNIREKLFTAFRKGQVEMAEDSKEKYSDDKALKAYISGLVNNWVRKAPEFNAGGKYTPKNPGSRSGSADEQIAEMKKLMASTNDAATKKIIQAHISQRLSEINASSQPQVDFSKIPASLRSKLGI